MIERLRKEVRNVQLRDITIEFLSNFYEQEENRNKILMVYKGRDYYTNLSYEEVMKISEEKELVYLLEYLYKRKDVKDNEDELRSAEKVLKGSPDIHYVLAESESKQNRESLDFYSDIVLMEGYYRKSLVELRRILKEEGVHTYLVSIPKASDIKEEGQHSEWKFGFLSQKINWTEARKEKIKQYLNKFTELEYEQAKDEMLSGHKYTKPYRGGKINFSCRTMHCWRVGCIFRGIF